MAGTDETHSTSVDFACSRRGSAPSAVGQRPSLSPEPKYYRTNHNNGIRWFQRPDQAREMKDVLTHAGIQWVGWHGFRRGSASNLNRLGRSCDSGPSTVAVTQAGYIKTAKQDAVAAMRQLSVAVKANCSPLCSPDVEHEKLNTVH